VETIELEVTEPKGLEESSAFSSGDMLVVLTVASATLVSRCL
jgi:hypothetical protein